MSVFIPNGRESFYCRVTIPLRLWSLVGRKDVWRSLKTTDRDLAEIRAAKWRASGRRLFLILKRQRGLMNKRTIDDLVQNWLDELLDEEVKWTPHLDEDLADYAELLHEQRLDNQWRRMSEQADDLLKAAGLTLDHGDTLFRLLCQRLLEGHIEYTRIQRDRLQGNYRPFNHHGALNLTVSAAPPSFRSEASPPTPPAPPPITLATKPEASRTCPFMDVVTLYFKENIPRSQRSASQIRLEFERFLKVIGGNHPIGDITKEDCRRYKEHLLHERKLRLVTVIKWLGMVGAIYRWASKQGFVPDRYNPVDGLAPSMKRAKAEVQGYRDYTDEELLTVFSSEEFQKQRLKHPEWYWPILICLFTGARREEVCQLALADIQEQDGIPFFNITDSGKDQMLKNDSSRRKIPIHSSLIALGFMDYIKGLRHQRGITRVFPQLTKSKGTYGNAVGKWYTRLIREVGLGDKGLVLHGLRHSFITRLSDVGVSEKLRMTLAGHASQGVHGRIYDHRQRVPMKLLQEGIERLQYPSVMQALMNDYRDEEPCPQGTQVA